eukprot:Hpha_TRINITY_DN16153_c2_g2::TRINITY_DN16153_c2_g2_i1::g.4233::m.4233/K17804/TIM44; mitochondrial import inner membrane translocase subunit TIM44
MILTISAGAGGTAAMRSRACAVALRASLRGARRGAAAAAEEQPRPKPPPQEPSGVLRAFVALGSAVESTASTLRNSTLGQIIAPQREAVHSWGRSEAEPEKAEESQSSVAGDTNGKAVSAAKKKKPDLRVAALPLNTTAFGIVAIGGVVDHVAEGDETGWQLFKKLMFSKRYKTTAQQATERLYLDVPDFSEPEFLEDVERNLLPHFLDAFWQKDLETLQSMCSAACFNIDVATHLKQYEKLSSQCELLMTRRANLFNRLMFVDDSEYAISSKRRKNEDGEEQEFDEDLDSGDMEPEPVFFVSCSAHIINEWVDEKGEVRAGDRDIPEDWHFVFGLTPSRGGKWSLSTLEFTRAQAMA